MTNIDTRISSPDQRLTADIEKWSSALSTLYSNLTKPTLDIILFSKKLSELVGWSGPMLIIGWYGFSAVVLKIISPPFGQYQALEQSKSNKFRIGRGVSRLTQRNSVTF